MSDKKSRKSRRIMEAALEIFGAKGFRDATVAEIAELAGVATGTAYEYFANKEDLYFSLPNASHSRRCIFGGPSDVSFLRFYLFVNPGFYSAG